MQGVVDEKIRQLLNDLHDAASKQEEELKREMAPYFHDLQRGKTLPWDQVERYMEDKYIALDPAQGVFCYLLAKAIGAHRIIEFGTSFGVSTIYLAMAVHDNGGGLVIGTEMIVEKAKRAQKNIRETGLSKFVDIRVGNALETLKNIHGPIDFFLNDGFPPYALAILKMVAPHMRAGSVIVTDNVGLMKADYREYLEYLRNPQNGFQSILMGLNEGTEFSVKMGRVDLE